MLDPFLVVKIQLNIYQRILIVIVYLLLRMLPMHVRCILQAMQRDKATRSPSHAWRKDVVSYAAPRHLIKGAHLPAIYYQLGS